MYITHGNRDVTIQNNIISRGASSGLKFQPTGGTHYVTNNLFVQNEIVGTVGGGQEDDVIEGQGAVIYWNNNVMVEAQDNGRGVLGGLTSSNLEGGEFRNNILAHASDTTAQAYQTSGYESQGVGVNDFTFSGNVIYDWKGRVILNSQADDLTFTGNILEETAQPSNRNLAEVVTGVVFADISGNQYYSDASTGTWFEIDGVDADYAAFIAETGETGSSNTQPSFTDDTRSATTYATTNGYDDWEDLVDDLVTQENGDWDTDIMADAINDWIRIGFDVDTVGETQLPSPTTPTSSSFVPTPSFNLVSADSDPTVPAPSASNATADLDVAQELFNSEQLENGEQQEDSEQEGWQNALKLIDQTALEVIREPYVQDSRERALAELHDPIAWFNKWRAVVKRVK